VFHLCACFTIPSSISLPYRIENSFFRFMGAAALQKYIGSLGGIGASGAGSSSSYTPKELNKEITPDKVSFQCFVPQILVRILESCYLQLYKIALSVFRYRV